MRDLLSGSDVCHHFVYVVKCLLPWDSAFLDREVQFQPEAVKLKGVCTHLGERLFPYFMVQGSSAFATRVEAVLSLHALLMESSKVVLCGKISTLSPLFLPCVSVSSLFLFFNFFPFFTTSIYPLKLEQLCVS